MATDFNWPHHVIVPIRLFAESRHALSEGTRKAAFPTTLDEAEDAANRVIASRPFQLWVLLESSLPKILKRRPADVNMGKLLGQIDTALNPSAPVIGGPDVSVQITFGGMKRSTTSRYRDDFVGQADFRGSYVNGATLRALQFTRPSPIWFGWF